MTTDLEKIRFNGWYITPTVNTLGADVFRVSANHVAKPLGSWEDIERWKKSGFYNDTLKREYEICKRLYESGVTVPEPLGIFEVALRGYFLDFFKPKIRRAFVMQYIPGPTLNEIMGTKRLQHAEGLWKSEIERAVALGFKPHDIGPQNAIWNKKEDQVYLVDFEGWGYEGEGVQ